VAFGKPLAELGANADVIANARIMLEQGRLLTLKAAWMLDEVGTKGARSEISQIKVAVPNIALEIIDQAIQMHGAAGVSDDVPLAELFATIRTLRIADGPDEVHRALIAKLELRKYKAKGLGPTAGEAEGNGGGLRRSEAPASAPVFQNEKRTPS
jgi:alkylation response protein AidB-like acyl-CoA dehydrogenase